MDFRVKVNYTDGSKELYQPVDRVCFCRGFTFELSLSDGIFVPTLSASESVALNSLEIETDAGDFVNNGSVCYSNHNSTNDRTQIYKLGENDTIRSESFISLRNNASDATMSMGLVTAHRFFAWVYFKDGKLSVRYEMEDKYLNVGELYILERFIAGDDGIYQFLDRYARGIESENQPVPLEEIPVGFCSWSCYFNDITHDKVMLAADGLEKYAKGDANLIQIDDGWQRSRPFPGKWVTDSSRFPQGIEKTADEVHKKGLKFGLWLAPLLISEDSEYYEELKYMVKTDDQTLDRVHPFDLDNPAFYQHLYDTFTKMTEEYHVDYFKLDFLLAGIFHFVAADHSEVRFESDYCVALFRRALMTIRRAVGDDVALLSCGAPILSCVGIFNAQRVSSDIIWGKNPDFPTYWEIMQGTTFTTLHRYFYNGKIFLNDPDGLVVRDFDKNDGFDCTYSEAKLWATTVAISGGSVLHNEELDSLSPARRKLFEKLTKPFKVAARPLDFFEEKTTAAYAELPDGRILLALYNYSDKLEKVTFDLAKIRMSGKKVYDFWAERDLGEMNIITVDMMNPHSAELYLIG